MTSVETILSKDIKMIESDCFRGDIEIASLLPEFETDTSTPFFVLTLIRKQMNTASHERRIEKILLSNFPGGKLVAKDSDSLRFVGLIQVPKLTAEMLHSHRYNSWFFAGRSSLQSDQLVIKLAEVFDLSSLVEQVAHLLNENTFCGRLWRDGERSALQMFKARCHP